MDHICNRLEADDQKVEDNEEKSASDKKPATQKPSLSFEDKIGESYQIVSAYGRYEFVGKLDTVRQFAHVWPRVSKVKHEKACLDDYHQNLEVIAIKPVDQNRCIDETTSHEKDRVHNGHPSFYIQV